MASAGQLTWTPRRELGAAREAARSAALPMLAVIVGGAVALAWYLHEAFTKLAGMQSTAWDLGFDQQVVWNIGHGHGFYSSFAHGDFLTDHFEIVLVIPALVERIWADPRVLLVFACAGLAATAPAAYLMFRELLGRSSQAAWFAAALAGPIPFWAASQQAARDDFHPENMALALAMFAVAAGLRGRVALMWTLVVLTLACKEDQVYTVGVAGLVLAASSQAQARRLGRQVIAAAVAWLVLVIGAVQNLIRIALGAGFHTTLAGISHAAPKAPDDYYSWLLNPTWNVALHTVANQQAWAALTVLVAGMCGLPLLRPRWFLLTLPPFAANLLSHHQPQAAMAQHYALLPMFPLIVSGGLGAQRLLNANLLSRAPMALAAGAIAIPIALGYVFGTLPPGRLADLRQYSAPDALAQLMRAESVIPPGAPVAADDGLTPWLASRPEITGFPSRDDRSAYVVIDRDAYLAPASWRAEHNAAAASLATEGRRLLFDDGRLQVWSPAAA